MIQRLLPGLFLPLAAGFVLAGCSSTKLEDTWVDPSLQVMPEARKVFVAYLGDDESVQRVAEDALAAHIHATEVVRCYQLFPDARALDAERVKARLREEGFEVAVVMRLTRVEKEVSWTSGTYYGHHGSFGSSWAMEPGSMRTDDIVHVETKLFSLAEDKLLYAARSETFNPSSTKDLVDEIAEDVADSLEEKGLLRSGRAQAR